MKKTPNAVTSPGTITAVRRPVQPRSAIRMYSGMMPSWCGTIEVAMATTRSAFRPRNRSLANANPARVEKNTTETVIEPLTMKEFTRARPKSVVSNTRAMLSKRCPPGTRAGGTFVTASLVCEDTTMDQ